MKVRDVMTADVETIGLDDSVKDAAKRMQILDIGFVPVCDKGRLIGTITDRDIAVRGVAEGLDLNNTKVVEIMTTEVFFCYEDQDLYTAAGMMKDSEVRRLVVMNRDQRMVGVLTLGDLSLALDQERLAAGPVRKSSDPAA